MNHFKLTVIVLMLLVLVTILPIQRLVRESDS